MVNSHYKVNQDFRITFYANNIGMIKKSKTTLSEDSACVSRFAWLGLKFGGQSDFGRAV